MVNVIYVYANNVKEIYDIQAGLTKQIANRIEHNKPVTIEHLATCSSMDKIIRECCRYGAKFGEHYTDDVKNEARTMIADSIIDECFMNMVHEAKKQVSMSVSGRYNYGPIKYMRKYVNTAVPLWFEKYIALVTDIKTYAVYCSLGFDVYIDREQLYYDVKRAFQYASDADILAAVNEAIAER